MSSSNPNPKRVPILDSFPNAPARYRRGREGVLRGTGSVRGGTSGSIIPSSSSGNISRGSLSNKSSSKGKETSESNQEPLVEEIVPTDLSFEHDKESLRDQIVRRDCRWRGFAVRGMSAEVAITLRASSNTPLALERTQATLSKRKVVEEDSDVDEDEDEDTSLTARPKTRRRIVSEDETEVSPARVSEPVTITSDEETIPRDSPESTRRLFIEGFESGELGPVLDEIPLSSSVPVLSVPPPLISSVSLPTLSISAPLPASTPSTTTIFTSSTVPPSIVPSSSAHYAEEGSSSRSMAMRSANLIGTELMNRISLLEKVARDSEKAVLDSEKEARDSQLEAANWKSQFDSAQITIEDLQEKLAIVKASSSQTEKERECLESSFSEQLSKSSEEIRELKVLLSKKEEYAGELVQNLSQAQADLQIFSDKVRALENSRASLKATLDSTFAENQMLKNDLASWEKDHELLEETFNTEVSWAFLNSPRDALTEASQENFDLESELAKVLKTIAMTQQPLDFPSPVDETPVAEEPLNEGAASVEVENVTIPAPEGETSLIQSVEDEVPVTLASLGDFKTSSPTASTSSEIAIVPTAASESEIDIATSEVPAPSVTS
ncbi:PREDICTED: flocculation protein FLO11-like [Nicotiana attenuata]|uniref:flocculation protein FLO11-like n=1 Tax=Nicotiana attenuata TaxID=49451 RepID=UPI0009056885|nr:PREDICTED: flocculation protein FLO11-like [Nicotiana attenuata]